MFGLQKYLEVVNEIQWFFDKNQWGDLESLLFVEFEKENDHYKIKKIKYTYVDILLGLEDMDFTFKKENGKYKLIILKI